MSHHHYEHHVETSHECHCHEHSHETHHHEHEHGSIKKQLLLIVLTVVLLVAAILIEKNCGLSTWQLLLVYLVPYLLIGHDTLKEALEGLVHGEAFNEHFLMSVATLGAFSIGFLPGADTEFPEAVFVMLFFQVGELFEGYAEGKSRESISHLMDIRPDVALVERSGTTISVSPSDVVIGETVIVKPGDKVPLDGIVVEGRSAMNTVALTGESVPREVVEGDEVISGCINLSGVLKLRTTKSFGESTVSKILELVEHAIENKSKSESFITRFARYYTPIVVFAAIAVAFIPPLVSGSFSTTFPTWLYRALMFLIVSCPCALVISVPLTFFGGIGGASRRGILIKGSSYMDILSKVGTVVFDKTGTLTHGQFVVEAVHPESFDERHLLHLAAHVEHFSTHPIAIALRDAFPEASTDGCSVSEVKEVSGQGIRALVDGRRVCVGNSKLMESTGVEWHDCHLPGTIIHMSIDGIYAGHIVINDAIKRDSEAAIEQLKALGVEHIIMLTGDREDVAAHVARQLHIDEYHSELLPTDKAKHVEQLLAEGHTDGSSLAFVGDGINDAPVLALSDVGIAMGGLGSDAAIEAADVVLMDDQPTKVSSAISIARHTLKIAWENVIFAIGVKVAVLLLAVFGLGTLWMAVFADVGVTVLAVLNAMRALRISH